MKLEQVYLSAGCNRSLKCMSWRKDLIIYGSCNSVVLVKKAKKLDQFRVLKSFVAHSDAVRSVNWITDDIFVSTSSDSTAVVWRRSEEEASFRPWKILKGHTLAVTACSGFQLENTLWMATASGDSSVKIWKIGMSVKDEEEATCCQTIDLKSGFALEVKFQALNGIVPFLVITRDNSKLQIYGRNPEFSGPDDHLTLIHNLSGHENWVVSVDLIQVQEDFLLASGSQDSYVRVWRLSPRTEAQAKTEQKSIKDLDENEEIKVKEEIVRLGCFSQTRETKYFAISLETVLDGHEDKVQSVQWRTRSEDKKLTLLSSSMDKTIIVWTADSELGGIWIESARVGEVGGNTLGFMGCQYDEDAEQILGYSFTGSFHYWAYIMPKWEPSATMGGHFGSVEDLDWDPKGRYLITTSSDQTTRVHAPWRPDPMSEASFWHEIARPQVHGFDLACLTMLPNHRFASGAEEKIVRTFQATNMFLRNFSSISKELIPEEETVDKKATGASVPSLGLSNKAVLDLEPTQPTDQPHVKDIYPDFYFTQEFYEMPPTEGSLRQNTLWPEHYKLYGHGYEIFCLASNTEGTLIASACKASKTEHAEVILWAVGTWEIAQRLPGHDLTVTQMAFSPNDQYFLTVSRDRTWCLYEKSGDKRSFRLIQRSKDKAVHQRLIWSCSWSEDSKYFATCSRDKKLAVWEVKEEKEVKLACPQVKSLQDSITSVAFAPDQGQGHGYLLACGLDKGNIVLLRFRPGIQDTKNEWEIVEEFGPNEAHHKTVKRIKFTRKNNSILLASCSADHSVRIFKLNFSGTLLNNTQISA